MVGELRSPGDGGGLSTIHYSPPTSTLARMWRTIGLLSVVCLGFIGLLVGLSLGGMG